MSRSTPLPSQLVTPLEKTREPRSRWSVDVTSLERVRSTVLSQGMMGDLQKIQEMQKQVDTMREAQAVDARSRRVREDLQMGWAALRARQLLLRAFVQKKLGARLARSLRDGFVAWGANSRAGLADSDASRRAAAGFYGISLRRATNSWMDYSARRCATRRAGAFALSRWRKQELVAGFGLLAALGADRRSMRRALRFFLHREWHQAWLTWHDFVRGLRARRGRLEAALHTLSPSGRRKRQALNPLV